jgi:hypothetical protein
MAWYDNTKLGKWRMPVGNAIRLMARAEKSREGDHFCIATGLKSLLDGYKPEIPDCAVDMHTHEGRRKGRGIEHFLTEGTMLIPAPAEPDVYAEEAANYLRRKAGGEKPPVPGKKATAAKKPASPVKRSPPPHEDDRMLWESNENEGGAE